MTENKINPPVVHDLHFNWRKAVEGVDYIASQWGGVSQYYICKIFYFADKEHCLDWSRSISGDSYVAMKHGPVPTRIYDMLKIGSSEEDEIIDYLNERVVVEISGNKAKFSSRGKNDFPALSESDIRYLGKSIIFCKNMDFSSLRDISHKELPWIEAAKSNSSNPPMNLILWFEAEGMDVDKAAAELCDYQKCRSK